MSEELKPCPFCGDKHPTVCGYDWIYVECDKCEATGPARETEIEAIKAWNTRAGEKA